MRGLEGRTVIVTGAASGIGAATARRLLEEGAQVMGADLAQGSMPDHPSSAFLATDVTNPTAVADLVRATVERFGRVDGAVTAAGVAGAGAVHQLPDEEWDRVLSVNLTGTFLVAKHVIAQMLDQSPPDTGGPGRAGGASGGASGGAGGGASAGASAGGPGPQRGSIVTLASIEGLEGTAGGSVYCASKGGVVLLTKNMAIDYGPKGIRVNAICPGFIRTPMTGMVFDLPGMEKAVDEFVHEHSLRRMGQPPEIAAAAAFLLSDDASFVSGLAMTVDGGYTAGRDHGITPLLGLSD